MLRWRMVESRGSSRASPSLAAELNALLHACTPPATGEPLPRAKAGLYERIAPSAQWDRLNPGRARAAGGTAGGAPSMRDRKPRFDVPAAASRRART